VELNQPRVYLAAVQIYLIKKKKPKPKKKKKKKKGGASENIHGGVVWRFFIVIWTTWLDF
jgi:hypothetical protein